MSQPHQQSPGNYSLQHQDNQQTSNQTQPHSISLYRPLEVNSYTQQQTMYPFFPAGCYIQQNMFGKNAPLLSSASLRLQPLCAPAASATQSYDKVKCRRANALQVIDPQTGEDVLTELLRHESPEALVAKAKKIIEVKVAFANMVAEAIKNDENSSDKVQQPIAPLLNKGNFQKLMQEVIENENPADQLSPSISSTIMVAPTPINVAPAAAATASIKKPQAKPKLFNKKKKSKKQLKIDDTKKEGADIDTFNDDNTKQILDVNQSAANTETTAQLQSESKKNSKKNKKVNGITTRHMHIEIFLKSLLSTSRQGHITDDDDDLQLLSNLAFSKQMPRLPVAKIDTLRAIMIEVSENNALFGNKMKLTYKPGHWSPDNQQGERIYDRELLLSIQFVNIIGEPHALILDSVWNADKCRLLPSLYDQLYDFNPQPSTSSSVSGNDVKSKRMPLKKRDHKPIL